MPLLDMAEESASCGVGVVRQIKARLGSAKLLLHSLRQDAVRHRAASQAQRCALSELMHTSEFASTSATEKAELVERATDILWHEDDLQTVLANLQPREFKERRLQRSSQVFSNFPDFFDEEKWQTLLDSDVSMSVKKVLILSTLSDLRCVTPCERTCKLINSFWLCCSMELSELRKLPSETKKLWLNELKRDFDLIQRRVRDEQHIREYPDSVEAFKAAYPGIYQCACRKPPVKSKLPPAMLSEVEASYRCRGGSSEAKPTVQSIVMQHAQQPQVDMNNGMQMMAQFMSCMMSQMQRQPENVLQGLLHGAPSSSTRRMTKPPLCLEDTVARSQLLDAIERPRSAESQPQQAEDGNEAKDDPVGDAEAEIFTFPKKIFVAYEK